MNKAEYKTEIRSNGSTWYGQPNHPIQSLYRALREYTLCESFFKFYPSEYRKNKDNDLQMNPITDNGNGTYRFFGNFEDYSHVFNLTTNDPALILRLTTLIKANKGWQLYYEKNLGRVCTINDEDVREEVINIIKDQSGQLPLNSEKIIECVLGEIKYSMTDQYPDGMYKYLTREQVKLYYRLAKDKKLF